MFNSTLNNLPHFSQFNHNLRNYLIKSEKWAVLLVSDGKGDKRVSNDFADKISMLRKRDRKLGYHFDESAIGNVVFISDRMTNTVIRLLQFLDLADRADVSTPFILTFRFHDGKLMGYRHSSPIIDNKFIFWISELVASPRVATVQHLRVCLAHQLIHYYQ